MCAIAGVIHLSCDEACAQALLQTMARRGPDGQGIYRHGPCTLLHTRLAIIDPAGGQQPMTESRGEERYTLVYNGELYNTAQLRSQLQALGHTFTDSSDTQVLLHAYMQWRDACLEKLNGIFAFGVWEQHSGRLFLARDRMGVKPLFFTCPQGGLIFASEIKTLLAHPAAEPRLDAQGAAQLLLLGPGRLPGSGVLRDIYEVEPGCCGYWEAGKLRLRRYWTLQDAPHTDSFPDTVQKVRWLVSDAIRRQTVSDVPMGAFLSGGLDSSLICAICAGEKDQPLKTFSVDYADNDRYFRTGKFQPEADGSYISRMQRFLGSEHHATVLSARQLTDCLEEATRARDLPGMADVDFSLLAFCRQIRPHVKMALSGECADEIFGGYPWYRDPAVRDAEGFPWSQNITQRSALLTRQLKQAVDGEAFVRAAYDTTLAQCDILSDAPPLERRMKQMVNLNYRWFMQTLLDRKDRMSMYCGLEVRVPFCDHRIAEYLYRVPWAYKDYLGREKGLLRHAFRDLLPEEVLWRKKSPYPKTFHPDYDSAITQRLEQLLQQPRHPVFALVDRQELQTLLSRPFQQPWYGQLMGRTQTAAYMLQLAWWLESYQVRLNW